MNVSELTIPQLNEWVAKALGWQIRLWGAIPVWFDPNNEGRYQCHVSQWNPSENWTQGGPIIDREKIQSRFIAKDQYLLGDPPESKWYCNYQVGQFESGETILIAAMRCFVASKFGEEVPQP